MLRQLALFGMEPIEDALLAGLATGEPVLLVGEPGCAKTLLARRVAEAMGLRFHGYDAGKAMFEDMIGYPDPGSLARGRIEYVPTPLSILDKQFVLVDELSRASPATANKWLEVIRSRRVMGLKLTELRFVLSAMNPPGGVGTTALDLALADRFAFHLQVPAAWQMSVSDLRLVIAQTSEDDAVALGRRVQTKAVDLAGFLDEARRRLKVIEDEIGGAVAEYVIAFHAAMKNARIELSGRRLGMIARNILAVLAVRDRRPRELSEVATDVRYAVGCSLPHPAAGIDVPRALITAAHGAALRSNEAPTPVLFPGDPLRMSQAYVKGAHALLPRGHHEVITAFEEALSSTSTPAEVGQAFLGLRRVLRALQDGAVDAPADVVLRCARLYESMTSLEVGRDKEWMDLMHHLAGDRGLRDADEVVSLLLTLSIFCEPTNATQRGRSELITIFQEIREEVRLGKEGLPT